MKHNLLPGVLAMLAALAALSTPAPAEPADQAPPRETAGDAAPAPEAPEASAAADEGADASAGEEDQQTRLRGKWPQAPAGARLTEDGWFAPRERTDPLPELPETVANAYVIPIREQIAPSTYKHFRRKAIQARNAGTDLILLDLDTPGGRSDAMDDIVGVLMQDLADVRTVAYVNPNAFSAGAIISLACDEIYMAPNANIGDAMPILIGPGGVQEIPPLVRGKLESAMRAQIRNLAKAHGYSPVLCEAMITQKMTVWLVRNTETGELQYVDIEEFAPGLELGIEPPGRNPGSPEMPEAYIRREAIEGYVYVRRIDGPEELITATSDEAVRLGLARDIVPSLDALTERYNVEGTMVYMEDTTHESVAAFLTSMPITLLLVLIGVAAVYVEINTPGLGIPAAVAVAAFAVLIGSHVLMGLAVWWEVLLFVLGIALLAAEIFVIPGFGVAGISGILLCLFSLLAMVIPNAPWEFPWPDTDAAWEYFSTGATGLLFGFLGSVVAIILLAKILPHTPLTSELFLGPAEEVHETPAGDESPLRTIQPGAQGVVASTCRPVGQVRIDGMLVDAVANGAMIESGARVRVVLNEGNRLVVERA